MARHGELAHRTGGVSTGEQYPHSKRRRQCLGTKLPSEYFADTNLIILFTQFRLDLPFPQQKCYLKKKSYSWKKAN